MREISIYNSLNNNALMRHHIYMKCRFLDNDASEEIII